MTAERSGAGVVCICDSVCERCDVHTRPLCGFARYSMVRAVLDSLFSALARLPCPPLFWTPRWAARRVRVRPRLSVLGLSLSLAQRPTQDWNPPTHVTCAVSPHVHKSSLQILWLRSHYVLSYIPR